MDNTTVSNAALVWPAAVYGVIVVLLVAAILVLSYLLGERHHARRRRQPYESGIKPTTSARIRFGIKYYLVAIFFLVFDIEIALVIAWAVSFYEVGWAGYIGAALFIITLAVGLLYIWKLRGLDWSPKYGPRNGVRDNER